MRFVRALWALRLDALAVVGLGLVAYGAGLFAEPLLFIVFGAGLLFAVRYGGR